MRHHDDEYYEEQRENQTYDRGPNRPKVEFSRFNGGDSYEWLGNNIHRKEKVSTTYFYLVEMASKWWSLDKRSIRER